jgi:thymidine phosphorylase
MNIIDIIEKKKNGENLNRRAIKYVIDGITDGSVKDYQMSALLMAICLKGMTPEETTNLTMVMRDSGDILDLSSIGKTVVDKHSTGGVGDKITLILMPIMAKLGVPVAKMSGRGLGFTGGTADKLEAIPGYKTILSIE